MSDEPKKSDKGFRIIDRRFWAREEDDEEDERDARLAETEPPVPAEDARVEELARELAEKDRTLREILAAHQESLSDLDSARERIRREVGREAELNRRSFLTEFLDVIDNLDRALEAAEAGGDPESLIRGVSMVRDLFVSKLGAFGVTRLEALGRRFDPAIHEAITVVPVDDTEQDGRVVGVIREGYAIGREVLRPAGVAVARKS